MSRVDHFHQTICLQHTLRRPDLRKRIALQLPHRLTVNLRYHLIHQRQFSCTMRRQGGKVGRTRTGEEPRPFCSTINANAVSEHTCSVSKIQTLGGSLENLSYVLTIREKTKESDN